MNTEAAKRAAGERAVTAEVSSGMMIGLGSGTTARYVIEAVGAGMRSGGLRDVAAVPTSDATARLAAASSIRLVSLAEAPVLDVCIDGADEIGPGLALIKGRGGALLREKVVACAARRFVIVADATKRVQVLGVRQPLPVEVIPFAEPVCVRALRALGAEPTRRVDPDGAPFLTDSNNWILDCALGGIEHPEPLAVALAQIPGLVEHGLFLGMAKAAYIASDTAVDVVTADDVRAVDSD